MRIGLKDKCSDYELRRKEGGQEWESGCGIEESLFSPGPKQYRTVRVCFQLEPQKLFSHNSGLFGHQAGREDPGRLVGCTVGWHVKAVECIRIHNKTW